MFLYKTIGVSGSLSSWTYREVPTMTILLFLFTCFTVIYLMNLFIDKAIDDYDKYEEFFKKQSIYIGI